MTRLLTLTFALSIGLGPAIVSAQATAEALVGELVTLSQDPVVVEYLSKDSRLAQQFKRKERNLLELMRQAKQMNDRAQEARFNRGMAMVGAQAGGPEAIARAMQAPSQAAEYEQSAAKLRVAVDEALEGLVASYREVKEQAVQPAAPTTAKQGAKSKAASGGCAKDTDCKGSRICEDGKCIDPAFKQ